MMRYQKIFLVSAIILFCVKCTDMNNTQSIYENKNVVANSKTSFKVWGNCGMCEETIENSLNTEGIAKADWNVETKMMNVSYDSTEINLDQIKKNIAAVGYDNEKYKAQDSTYSNLRECCKYERKK